MPFGQSDFAIKKHGYIENNPPLEVTGSFISVCIYQLNGIQKFDENQKILSFLDENIKFGIGNNINELCFLLFNKTLDDMYESEEILTKETHLPYLVTATRDNDEYTYQAKWTQWYNESLLSVYDPPVDKKYSNKIKSIQNNDSKFIPFIIYSLSSPDIPVTATLLNNYFYLVLPDGKLCQTLKFQGDLEGGAICKKILSDYNKELIRKYEPFHEMVSHLMVLSMREDDNLKKFLFSWNALEILITTTFSKLPQQEQAANFPNDDCVPEDYKKSVSVLYENKNRGRGITNVSQKFIYLSIYKWKITHNGHYDIFRESKERRDKFLHGSLKYVELLPWLSRNNLLIINNIIHSILSVPLNAPDSALRSSAQSAMQ
ncbi:hypothetical protein [Candidatus Electronema sp. JC]|uniref:hypothetical protein n=1 Tax=Candidatus Electronema sp. JC TaxID=3401570 RepID=UPI003B432CA1